MLVTSPHVGHLLSYDSTANCFLRLARNNHRPFAFRSNRVGLRFLYAIIFAVRISRSCSLPPPTFLGHKDRLSHLSIGIVIIF